MGADQATPAPTATRLSAFRREMRSSGLFTAFSLLDGIAQHDYRGPARLVMLQRPYDLYSHSPTPT